jgi:hypothetical protein
MSDTETKEKHSKRIHSKETAIKKQVKIAKSHGFHTGPEHRLSKIHATTCGDPNCAMCGNPRKFFKEPTIQEKRFYQGDEHHAYHGIDSEDPEVPNT